MKALGMVKGRNHGAPEMVHDFGCKCLKCSHERQKASKTKDPGHTRKVQNFKQRSAWWRDKQRKKERKA